MTNTKVKLKIDPPMTHQLWEIKFKVIGRVHSASIIGWSPHLVTEKLLGPGPEDKKQVPNRPSPHVGWILASSYSKPPSVVVQP